MRSSASSASRTRTTTTRSAPCGPASPSSSGSSGSARSIGLPVPLRVRVGINTGPVAIGTESSEQGLLFGATVNFAARLQQAADPGTVLVSETDLAPARARRSSTAPREVDAKGFDDDARGVAGGRRSQPGSARAARSRSSTASASSGCCTTRSRASRETRRGHLVTLFGEPGIGKSRVAEEFLAGSARRGEGAARPGEPVRGGGHVRAARADAAPGAGGARGRQLGPAARARLEELVGELLPRRRDRADRSRGSRSRSGSGTRSARRGARYRVAEIRAGLLALLARPRPPAGRSSWCSRTPHQAQASMLDLIEQVVREAKRHPVARALRRALRPARRPSRAGAAGGGTRSTCTSRRCRSTTRRSSRRRPASAWTWRRRSGSPATPAATRSSSWRRPGCCCTPGTELPADTDSLPRGCCRRPCRPSSPSRIDHLSGRGPRPRPQGLGVRALDVRPGRARADRRARPTKTLERARGRGAARARPRAARRRGGFRHGLVRDVAYESLPKRERQRLHLLVADGLSDPETAARYPRSIAYHLEQAAQGGARPGPARPHARRAGGRGPRARRRPRARASRTRGRPRPTCTGARSRSCGPERTWGTPRGLDPRRPSARRGTGSASSSVGGPALERALELGAGRPRSARRPRGSSATSSCRSGATRSAPRSCSTTRSTAARELGDPWTLARTLLVAAWAPYCHGRTSRRARAMFEEALADRPREPRGRRWSEARALARPVGARVATTGDEDESLALASGRALAVAETTARPVLDRDGARGGRQRAAADGAARRGAGHTPTPRSRASASSARRWELASALTSRGIVHRLAGRPEDAAAGPARGLPPVP